MKSLPATISANEHDDPPPQGLRIAGIDQACARGDAVTRINVAAKGKVRR